MKKHIITIAGDHASGQGTLSNLLKEKYGYEIYRNGQYVRKLAKENNMSITQFQDYLKIHPELDRKIEQSAKEYADSRDNLIIDAKLGWYSVPESFKIYLKVDIKEAVKRAFMDENRKDTENYISKVLSRLTVFGALFLVIISALPIIFSALTGLSSSVSVGGTSLLIVVGVALETYRQLEGSLLTRNYKKAYSRR